MKYVLYVESRNYVIEFYYNSLKQCIAGINELDFTNNEIYSIEIKPRYNLNKIANKIKFN